MGKKHHEQISNKNVLHGDLFYFKSNYQKYPVNRTHHAFAQEHKALNLQG